LKVPGAKEKGWTLSKLYASKKKEAEKAALEEKKAAAQAAAEGKRLPESRLSLTRRKPQG
jgi:hypothetical protein